MLAAHSDEKSMEVYVSVLESPAKFWVQFVCPELEKQFKNEEEMAAYYGKEENRERHKITEPYVGQIVAGFYCGDEKYYRAEIVKIFENYENSGRASIELYYVDYGDTEYVELKDIYELRTDFSTTRFQAVQCYLANVKPPRISDPDTWPEESNTRFDEIREVSDRMYARVVTYKERSKAMAGSHLNSVECHDGSVAAIELIGTWGGPEVNFGELLIQTGFALPLDNHLSRSRS